MRLLRRAKLPHDNERDPYIDSVYTCRGTMIEFVSFTGPHVGQDVETRKRVRSQAMRDYRKRQRQNRPVESHCEDEPVQETKFVFVKCSSDVPPLTSAPCQPQPTSQSRARRTRIKLSNITKASISRSSEIEDGHESLLTSRESCLVDPYALSSLPQINAMERYDLHYFHQVVMKDIAGLVYVGFWDNLMPRLCQSEAVVRQAVIALSRTHAELAYNGSLRHPTTVRDTFPSSQSTASALEASKALRTYIEKSSSPSYELVLTCSIIFHAQEFLRGAEKNGLCHLENALAMFEAWKQRRRQYTSGSEEGFDEIATVLARLDLSATVADDYRVPVFQYDHEDLPVAPRLTDAHDAHYQLMKIGTPAWSFLIRNKHWRDVPIGLVPEKIVGEQRLYLRQFRLWSVAADQLEWDISARKGNKASHADTWERERRVAEVSLIATRMHHWCSKRMLEEGLQNEQCPRPFDRNPHKLLRYARSIIESVDAAENGVETCRRMSFSPEISVCGILFLLAHRTTDPGLRIEALRLARYFNRIEGARDIITAFERWASMPEPKPGFPYMLGEPGF
jgi:hypothetical protein